MQTNPEQWAMDLWKAAFAKAYIARPTNHEGAAALIQAAFAEREARLVGALREGRRIITEIDDYMKQPDRGDWGVECACCMGELLDDDRDAIARIDATLAPFTKGQTDQEREAWEAGR